MPTDSEQDAAGSWILRDLHHAPIATVSRTGDVALAHALPPPQAVFVRKEPAARPTPGIEVRESEDG
ncbi:MAG: hypothetical protein WDM77_09745 [Steroidobacteraceae bacterium]